MTLLRETYTLNGSQNWAQNDQIVELERLRPPVAELATEDDFVLLVELRKRLADGRILGSKSTLLKLFREGSLGRGSWRRSPRLT